MISDNVRWARAPTIRSISDTPKPADQTIHVSATRNPYSIPAAMDQTFLANSASTLSQHCPLYLGTSSTGYSPMSDRILCVERPAFIQYQKASAELEPILSI